jgi:exodeoxyribonuclease V beta subunit
MAKSPKNLSLAKEILVHPFIGWPLEKLGIISEIDILSPFIGLGSILRDDGLAAFLTHLVKLTTIESKEDYADLMQMISLILESNPESLHKYLEKLSLLEADDHPSLKRKPLIDKSNIHIMTSHMSKGLEFDIVFALGTSIRQKPSPLKSPLDQDLEKLRLFYVAATRAKEKLYLFIKITKDDISKTSRAPIELLLAKLAAPDATYSALPNLNLEEIKATLLQHKFPFIEINAEIFLEKKLTEKEASNARIIDLPALPHPRQFTSFSSLTQTRHTSLVPKESDLPRGSDTGNLFHLLLEKIIEEGTYFDWKEDQIRALIKQEIVRTHLENFEPIIYDLLYAAFHTQLSSFCLKDVLPGNMLQEHPFCYTLSDRSYMKGVIDLVFLYKNHYYILDWKMNLLASYDPESMHLAMSEHSYFTQAAIYKEAIERTLRDHPFKNTFYFFLRGKQNGIIKL